MSIVEELKNGNEKVFWQYVRDENRNPIGVVVGFPETDSVGWSSVKRNKTHGNFDKFDKEKGLFIAVNRADCGYNSNPPARVKKVIDIMYDRLWRYKNPKSARKV